MRLALLCCVALSGCTFLSVEAEIPDACITFEDQEVEGMAPGVAYTRTFTADELKIVDGFVQVDAVITDAHATLTARSGVSDLSFLQRVSVEVKSSTGALPPAMLVACNACASSTMTTEIAAEVPENLIDYARNGSPRFTVTLEGDLPTVAWRTDIMVCLAGRARVSIGP